MSEEHGPRPPTWWENLILYVTALTLTALLLAFLWFLARPLALLLLAVSLAAALAPVAKWLGRRLPRVLAVILIYLVLSLALVGVGWIIVPSMVEQLSQFADRAPELVAQVEGWIESWGVLDVGALFDRLASGAGGLTNGLITLPVTVVSHLGEGLLVVFFSFYMLILTSGIRSFFLSLFPKGKREGAHHLASRVVEAMGGYVRGTAISVVIMAILTYVGLLVVDVDYPLVLGLIAGLMEVIPIVGGVVTAILMVLVALTESFTKALITLVLAVALQQFEANVVVPNIMQVEAKTSPLLTLFAVIAGATVGGVVGALVAIPLAAALRILVIEALAPEIRRRLGAAPPDPPSD